MNALVGQSAVLLGFLAALAGAMTYAVGVLRGSAAAMRNGRIYVWLLLAASIVAVFAMQRALLTHDFSLAYVAKNNSLSTPTLFSITGMWSALEGSILLWALVLAGYTAAVAVRFRAKRLDPLMGWAMLTMLLVSAFFFGLMLGPANPFKEVAGAIPADGPGPNPLLQNHPLVAFHPPMLYLGYVGFTVPFAFAVGALVTGRLGEGWLAMTRRWTLFAWGFLTLGIVLGAWWSYEVLGWGGYWAWDPVENASFLPWLTGTAFIHSVMVQERRGMLRVWNLSLLLATFSLTILGTFLTRSGVLDSVHAFTESPIGPAILTFFGIIVLVGVGLIGWRGDQLRSPGTMDSPLSREGAFLANNILFAAFAFVVLLGTVFPLVVEALNGELLSVGRPYFDSMTRPIGFTLLFLMAVAPVLPWRKASGELLRTRLQWPLTIAASTVVLCVAFGLRGAAPLLAFALGAFAAAAAIRQLFLAVRRQGWRGIVGPSGGGMVVHVGVVIIAVALAASSSYATRKQFRMAEGETRRVAGHTVTYLGTREVEHPNKISIVADVRVDGGEVYRPSLNRFPFATDAIGTPSVRTSLVDDVYLTLAQSPRADGEPAVIGVIVQPLVLWLWVGGVVMGLGTALSLVPGRRRRTDAPEEPASAETPELVPA